MGSDDESSHDKHHNDDSGSESDSGSEKSDKSDKSDKSRSEEESSVDSESDSESYVLGYRVGKASKRVHAFHWSYTGKCGPAHWGDLKPAYAIAKEGTCQSPIDLTQTKDSEGVDVSYNYQETPITVLNNGHTIQVNYAPGSTMNVNGTVYELKQFHFHLPSEHTVDGEHRAMEMHLVHQNAQKQLAVLGVFIQPGEENEIMAPIWAALPPKPPAHASGGVPPPSVTLDGSLCAASLLPENKKMFRYSGSLTTPPCSEGVYWLVLQEPIQMSKAQIATFRELFQFNNRPVQQINDRELFAGDELKQ